MLNAASAAGFIDLFAGVMALEMFFFLDSQSGAGTAPSAQAPPLDDSAVELWLPLAAAGTLLTSVAFIYHHLSRAAANRRLSGVVIFVLFMSVGVLDLFVLQPAGGGVDAGALGRGALRALPAAAAATFFWGMMMLIIVAHVRAGAGNGAVQGHVRLLTKVAVGAAAGLVFLVTVAAFCIKY